MTTRPRTIILRTGDRVQFKAGVPQYLICCGCGLSHEISFDRPTTMTITEADAMTARERRKLWHT